MGGGWPDAWKVSEVLRNCANVGRGKAAVGFFMGCLFLNPTDIEEKCELE